MDSFPFQIEIGAKVFIPVFNDYGKKVGNAEISPANIIYLEQKGISASSIYATPNGQVYIFAQDGNPTGVRAFNVTNARNTSFFPRLQRMYDTINPDHYDLPCFKSEEGYSKFKGESYSLKEALELRQLECPGSRKFLYNNNCMSVAKIKDETEGQKTIFNYDRKKALAAMRKIAYGGFPTDEQKKMRKFFLPNFKEDDDEAEPPAEELGGDRIDQQINAKYGGQDAREWHQQT